MMTEEKPMAELDKLPDQNSTGRIIIGLTLLAPALILCISQLLIPTVNTLITSLQKAGPLIKNPEFVGLKNYTYLFSDDAFFSALGYTLLWVLVRVLIVAIAPLLLALVVNQFGRGIRISVRLLFTIPIVVFVPVAIALAWLMLLNPMFGLLSGNILVNPHQVRPTLLLIDALYVLGLAGGIGLVVYPAALRREDTDLPRHKALIPLGTVWLIGLLATIALTLQSFSFIHTLTGGGPAQTSLTMIIYQYKVSFMQMKFGVGAALASLSLLTLIILGIITGVIVVLAGLQLKTISPQKTSALLSGMNKPLAIILLVIFLLISLGIGALSVLPFIWTTLNSFGPTSNLEAYQLLTETISIRRMLINTLVPLIAGVLFIQLPIAYLGALGIGALRPLGRRSELLLLLFSPWLFVTIGPLSIPALENAFETRTANTLISLAPPILLSIPIFFILTLFFKGRTVSWQTAQEEGESIMNAFFTKLIAPSLPLVALLAAVAIFVGLQEVMWPLLIARSRDFFSLNLILMMLNFQFGTGTGLNMVAAALTLFWLPLSVLFFLIFAVFQLFYIDRLSISR